MSDSRMVQIQSHAFVHHLQMSIETYRDSIKTTRDVIDTGGGSTLERVVEQFERQIQDCQDLIEVCEESDFVEFKRNED